MDNIENFGKRLKELRESRELTMDMVVYDVSNTYQIEFTKGNLSRWENGVNYPSLVYAAYLAKYYNVSLDYLIGNTDVKAPVELLTRKNPPKPRQKIKIPKTKIKKRNYKVSFFALNKDVIVESTKSYASFISYSILSNTNSLSSLVVILSPI